MSHDHNAPARAGESAPQASAETVRLVDAVIDAAWEDAIVMRRHRGAKYATPPEYLHAQAALEAAESALLAHVAGLEAALHDALIIVANLGASRTSLVGQEVVSEWRARASAILAAATPPEGTAE